jgi:GxxExxY protein
MRSNDEAKDPSSLRRNDDTNNPSSLRRNDTNNPSSVRSNNDRRDPLSLRPASDTRDPTSNRQNTDPGDRPYMRPNKASHAVIGCALKVHSALGPGMLESTISACLFHELTASGLHVQHQVRLPVMYKGVQLPNAYRVDFIIEKCLIVEVKCVEKLLPVHKAQVIAYLKLTGLKLGLLINFNVPHLRQGIKRVISGPESEL